MSQIVNLIIIIFLEKIWKTFKYRKNILVKQGFDKNKTEREIMKERKFHRIYDCGAMKFEWKKRSN